MRIIHISPSAPYNEGWSYQENLLPKYQAKLGHDVTLIVTTRQHSDKGFIEIDPCDYISQDNVRIIRKKSIPSRIPRLKTVFARFLVYDLLTEIKPDFIFYHGFVSTAIFQAAKYKKNVNPACIIVQDNHLDYNIGRLSDTWRGSLLKAIYRSFHRATRDCIAKAYGVTPWRKIYLEDIYKVSPSITDVLIMGADDDKIDFEHRDEIRSRIRSELGITKDQFLIVTGGKIDRNKNIHLLMEAVNKLNNVRLVVFGNIQNDIRADFEKQLSDRVQWIGWINADRCYDYFFASDLVMFPGQHSVLWEQACATKVPCVFAKWPGMDHVNNGGNAIFIENIDIENLTSCIEGLIFSEKYANMKKAAESELTDIFLYSNIARKSIEAAEQ